MSEQQQSMTLEQFRQARTTGVDLYAEQPQGAQEDAAPNAPEGADNGDFEPEVPEQGEEHSEEPEPEFSGDPANEDVDDIPADQKNAFYKRMQRERKKAQEEAEAKLRQEFEARYNPMQAFMDRLGINDPKQAMEMLERQQLQQQAQQMAYEQGWTDDQAQMWVRQQELEKKQTEMQVDLQLYQIEETKKYPGIRQMKSEITAFIRQNPRATAEQAYFAVGGPNLLQQMKRESEQREIAKRTQTKRTVITDAPTDMKGPEPLSADEMRFMRRTGMSEAQFRTQYKGEGPQTLEDYRRMKKKG